MFTGNLLADGVDVLLAEIPDIILLIAVLIMGIIQAKRGFFACVFSFVGAIAAIVISVVATPHLVTWLENTWGFTTAVSNWLEGIISNWSGFNVAIGEAGTQISESDLTAALSAVGVPGFILQVIISLLPSVDFAGKTIAQIVAPVWGGYILSGICYVVLFLVVRLVFWIVGKLLTKIFSSIKPIKVINSLLGFFVGLLQVAIFTYGLLFIATIIPWQAAHSYLQNSFVVGFMYNNNLLALLIGKFFSGDWFAAIYTALFPAVL